MNILNTYIKRERERRSIKGPNKLALKRVGIAAHTTSYYIIKKLKTSKGYKVILKD